jgi:hypothetical protein
MMDAYRTSSRRRAVLVGRPQCMTSPAVPTGERARVRAEQRNVVVELIGRYSPDAVVCVGIPFGHAGAVDRLARRRHHRRRAPPARMFMRRRRWA